MINGLICLVIFFYSLQLVFLVELGDSCGTEDSQAVTDCLSYSEGNYTCCLWSYSSNSLRYKRCRMLINESPLTLYNSYIAIIKSFPNVITESSFDCGTNHEECFERIPSKKEECTSISQDNPYTCCYLTTKFDSLCFPVDITKLKEFTKEFTFGHVSEPPSVICQSNYVFVHLYYFSLLFLLFII